MTMDISATMGYLTSLMDFSYLDSYFENTSSMFIALVFVLLTMVLLSVFEYLSKLKLKTRQELEEENSKREAKAQKKKSQKKKKNEREELAQEASEKARRAETEKQRLAELESELDPETLAIQAMADRYNVFKAGWKNDDIYLGDYHIYAHAQRKNSCITACTLVKGAHVTYLPDAQFINFMDLDKDKRLTLVDFAAFRTQFNISQVSKKQLNGSELVYYDCANLDFDKIFETCQPARL